MTRVPLRLAAPRLLAIAACALMLSGCISLLPKSKPAQLYRFGPSPTSTQIRAPAGRPVAVFRSNGAFQNEAAGDQMLAIFSDEGPLSLFGFAVAGKLSKYAVALNRMSYLFAQYTTTGINFRCQVKNRGSLFANHLGGAVTEHQFRTGIEKRDHSIRVGGHDGIELRGVQQRGESGIH